MNFYNEVKEIIHSEYDWDDISSGKIAKAITDIHNKQLANSKYLNADEVRAIYDKLFITMGVDGFIQAICKLAIPDIDRDKIIENIINRIIHAQIILCAGIYVMGVVYVLRAIHLAIIAHIKTRRILCYSYYKTGHLIMNIC